MPVVNDRNAGDTRKQSDSIAGDHRGSVPFTSRREETQPTHITRVVSNDDEDEGYCVAASPTSSSSSRSSDDIPDLTMIHTRSFDEEDEIIHGHPQGTNHGSRSLPGICEEDASQKSKHNDGYSRYDNSWRHSNIGQKSSTFSPVLSHEGYDVIPTNARNLSPSSMSTPQTRNVADNRSALYDEVCRISAQCAEMQKRLEAREDRIKEVSGRLCRLYQKMKLMRLHHNTSLRTCIKLPLFSHHTARRIEAVSYS